MARYSDGTLDKLWSHGLLHLFEKGILELRDGTPPVNANLAPTGTLLYRIELPTSPFKMLSSSAIGISSPWVSQSNSYFASGTPTWARLKLPTDSNSIDANKAHPRIDCSVGTALPFEMIINPGVISAKTLVTVQSFTIVRL